MMPIELMDHQEAGIDWLRERDNGLLHWDAGTGKTFPAAFVAGEVGRALIVCPAVARLNWRREIRAMLGDRVSVNVVQKGSDNFEGGDFVVVSYELAARKSRELAVSGFDVLVLDESQFLKNPSAKRTRAVFGPNGLARAINKVWCLSGTPTPNHIAEIYPWLACRLPHLIAAPSGRPMNFYQFRDAFCEVAETPYGSQITGTKAGPSRELWQTLSPYVDRILKADVLKDLPPVRFQEYAVLGDANAREVRRLEQEHRDAIEEVINGAQNDEFVAMHLTTLRRVTEIAKVGDAISLVRQELQDRAIDKIVIFANYLDTIDAVVLGLDEFNPVAIHGSISPTRRQDAIDRFQDDPETRVFIGQLTASSTAITLHAHGACQDVLFISADWVPATNAQAVSRVHRKGQTNAVNARFLHLENSLDEQVQKALIRKSHQISTVFEERTAHHAA